MENKDLVKELGIKDGYVNIKLNDKFYIMRRPTALEEIDIQDNNVSVDGEVDIYGYISDILKFVSPKITMKDIVKKISNKIVVGDKTLTFEKLTAEDGLRVLLNSQKVGVNSEGQRVTKINQGQTVRKIVGLCDEHETIKIDDFKTKQELNDIFNGFSEIVDVTGAMTLFETFQKTFQN